MKDLEKTIKRKPMRFYPEAYMYNPSSKGMTDKEFKKIMKPVSYDLVPSYDLCFLLDYN